MFKGFVDGFGNLTIDWKTSSKDAEVTSTLKLPRPYEDLEIFLRRYASERFMAMYSKQPLPDDVKVTIGVINEELGTLTDVKITNHSTSTPNYPGFFFTGITKVSKDPLLSKTGLHYRVKITGKKCSSRAVNLALNLSRAFESQLCADFKITIGSQVIPVSKFVLMTHSDVFKTMIKSNLVENRSNEVSITDVEYEPMVQLVKTMYTGQLNLKQDVQLTFKVLTAADKYNVQAIVKACEQDIIEYLSDSNVRLVLTQANKVEAGAVRYACEEYLNKLDKPKLIELIMNHGAS